MATYFCVNSSLGQAWNSSNTTMWSTTSGLVTAGVGPPAAADAVVFDSLSGGGTVTVASSINTTNTLLSVAMGTFTGTLDFSVNNPSMTYTSFFSNTGASTKTLNFGSGTHFIPSGIGTIFDLGTSSNCTLVASACTIAFTSSNPSNTRTCSLGVSKTYGTLSVSATPTSGFTMSFTGTTPTIGTLTTIQPVTVSVPTGTISNALSLIGTPAGQGLLSGGTATTSTLTLGAGATIDWMGLQNIAFAGSAVNATNSFNLRGTNMNGGSITPPQSGGGGVVIGS